MKAKRALGLALVAVVASAGCAADWATQNSTPFYMEIAGISPSPIFSDVASDDNNDGGIVNDDATVTVNIWRKNNNPDMSTSPVEHIFLERYEVHYFRTDGRNTEGVDVPYAISGPLGNVRFHTPGPGGGGEVEIDVPITVVRHQAKLEPPLRNLAHFSATPIGGIPPAFTEGSVVLTTIAEITIHARTVQGGVLTATGRSEVAFANFADD